MVKSKNIPIVLAFTPNYLVPAATCLLSILEHAANMATFDVICLLSETLTNDRMEQLRNLDRTRLTFTFLDLQDHFQHVDIHVDARYTIAASYRLLLADLLPDYARVIYLDCDLIVRNDLATLFQKITLTDYYMAGVFEATLASQQAYMKEIGCQDGAYINSGFLVMNLALLRADKMGPKLLLAAQQKNLQFPDQDVINQLCQGKILGLPPYYNAIRTFFLPQYKKDFLRYYSPQDWLAVARHGTVHYTGSKPWNSLTVQFALWWSYYEKLPKGIKTGFLKSRKYYLIFKIYNTPVFRQIVDLLLSLYRHAKYKLK